LKNLDEVIDLIRRSPDAETARTRLTKRFHLTDIQAQAILDMPLRRLAALERKKIEEEYKEVQTMIKGLESLLRSPKKMRQVVGDELTVVKDTFADPRRTQIVQLGEGQVTATLLTTTDLVAEQSVWVMASPEGLISRTADDKPPRLSGRDVASVLITANTRDTLYLAASNGEAAAIPMHLLPIAARPSEGLPIYKISPFSQAHQLAAAFALPAKEERAEDWFVLSATTHGMVKKSVITELPGASAHLFTLAKVNPDDSLGWVHLTNGKAQVLLVTADGMAICFDEDTVRPMGLVAAGVMGIKLQQEDEVVAVEILVPRNEVLLVATDGSAKRMAANQFPLQGRYGQGVIAWKLPRGVRVVGVMVGKPTARTTLTLADLAPKSIRLDEAPLQNRAARGKKIFELKPTDRITGLVQPREISRPRSGGAPLRKPTRKSSQPAK
jgi:DNA gyrase subunit A